MRTPRRSAINQSTLAKFGKLGQMFGLCGGPYAHTIYTHSHDDIIKCTPSSRKKYCLLRLREHSRVSGHDTRHEWLSCWIEHSRVSELTKHKWMKCWREHWRVSGLTRYKWMRCWSEHSRVSRLTKHKWMRCWHHSFRLCPVLSKWSPCGANQHSCS
jgi:hypothetical protein